MRSGIAVALMLVGMLCEPAGAADAVRLTEDGSLKRDPIFTSDGEAVIYTLLESPTQLRLMRLELSTGEVRPLHEDAAKSEFEPALSRDGRYLAFVQSRGNLSLALVIRDREQQRDFDIPPEGGFSGMRSPEIAPDNSRVLYAYPAGGRQHVFSVDLSAQDRRQLTDSDGYNNWPRYSPDGSRIVFSSTRDGNYEIYSMRADGTDVRRLTTNRFQDIRPRYAPDGKRIVFTSSRDGNYEIYVMNAEGGNLTRVTAHPERDDYAAWHPDSEQLVTVAERKGQYDLYLLNAP